MGSPLCCVGETNVSVHQSLCDKLCGMHSGVLRFVAPDHASKTTESEMVRGILRMLQGSPSSLFYWDEGAAVFCVKDRAHVSHLSKTSLRQILDPFLYAAACLQRVELFVKKVELSNAKSPPTLRAFFNAVALWLKRLRKIALEEELELAQSGSKIVPTLLRLASSLSSLCSGAEFLMQVVDEAIPCSYFECDTSFSAAEITVCILDYLYWKLDELCPVQGGEEEPYHLVLFLFVGSLLPYIEKLDSWLHDGTLDDPFEEVTVQLAVDNIYNSMFGAQIFFYANGIISIDQPAFWENSYLLRVKNRNKLGLGDFEVPKIVESSTGNYREIEEEETAVSADPLRLKDHDNNGCVVCPIFLQSIAKSILSAGKSLHLLQHASGRPSLRKDSISNSDKLAWSGQQIFKSLNIIDVIGEKSKLRNGFTESFTLPEIFCISLSRLIGGGCYLNLNFGNENLWSMEAAQLDRPCLVKTDNVGEIGSSSSANNIDFINSADVTNVSVHKEGATVPKSFWPENPALNVCRDFLFKDEALQDMMNVSKNVCLPPLNDRCLREAIFGSQQGDSVGKAEMPSGTNYIAGFQYDEIELMRLTDEKRMLSTLFPFPTLLPHFQEDVGMSKFLPFQKNTTIAAGFLDSLLKSKPNVLQLPDVILHECLVAFVGRQVDCIGEQILLKLMNGWKLMDELIVLRAIYLLGSGDLLQHFLIMLFNKLDKGENWDDEFELNTLLQESIRNSADGALLNAPDSLVVSILNSGDSNLGKNKVNGVTAPKGIASTYGIDVLDVLKFTYKVSWPLELIANVDARKKYNQVMCFLLKVKRAKFVLDKSRRWMWKDTGINAVNRKRLFLVEQKLLQFVDAFHQYVMDRVFHNTWLDLCEGMSSAKSLDEVMEVHEAYLLSVQRLCFVAPDKLWALIANRIKSILGLALDFSSIQLILSTGNTNPAVKESCEKEVDRIEKQFDDCIIFLLRVLSFKLNVGQFPHLADLVTRINYNFFYMSQSGSVLTTAASEATAAKVARNFPAKGVFQTSLK